MYLNLNRFPNLSLLFFFFSYPNTATIRLLLMCGMDVNTVDSMKNTALHILARNIFSNDSTESIDFLCNTAGAHLDFADVHGECPIDIPAEASVHTLAKVRRLRQRMGVRSLKCRCAHLAKYGRLLYEECLSPSLVKFVSKH